VQFLQILHRVQSKKETTIENKYFDFSGRIGGTTYFLRSILANIFQYIAGFICGVGWETNISVLLLGCGMLFLACWYTFATVYKRANAIDPKNVKLWTGVCVVIGCVLVFENDDVGHAFFKLSNFLMVVMHLIFIFKNAEPQKDQN